MKTKQNNLTRAIINIALKTMGIKARFFNLVRKELWPYGVSSYQIIVHKKKPLTDADKIRLFDLFYNEFTEANSEERAYKTKRRFKAEVLAKRVLKAQDTSSEGVEKVA